MNYIDEIFERANIQDIRELLLHGAACLQISSKSYIERLKNAEKDMEDTVEQISLKDYEQDKLLDSIWHHSGKVEDVYMEIGLQCGFTLAMQLFQNIGRNER